MFRHAGIACKVTDDLARAHWEKLVWNIPFNGLGVASAAGYDAFVSLPSTLDPRYFSGACLTTDKLLSDSKWEQLVRELMREIIAAARALKFKLSEELVDQQIERTRSMG